MLPCSRGDKNSRFFSILLPRPQVCSLLSNGFLLALHSDFQALCVCQALGTRSGKSQALSLGLVVHMKHLATHGRRQVCRRLARPLHRLQSKKACTGGSFSPFLRRQHYGHPRRARLILSLAAWTPRTRPSADSRVSLPALQRSILHRQTLQDFFL